MVVDFRYHVASLVAVFLALGLGIFIGTAMMGDDPLVKQQTAMIDRLEQDLGASKSERKVLAAKQSETQVVVERDEQFESSVLPSLVRNRLAGRRVCVVITADALDSGLLDRVKSVLKQAGASVLSTTRVSHLADLGDDKKRTKAASVLGFDATRDPKELAEALCRDVAADLAGGASTVLSPLASLKLIQINGQYDLPVDSCVIVTGSELKPTAGTPRFDGPLIDSLRDGNVRVVGVESTDSLWSGIPTVKAHKASSVDNADTSPGLLSMVIALQGANGAFGVKDTAKQYAPDISLWP